MTNPHPHREVLIAIAEGREIECKYSPDGIWNPIADNSVCNPLAQPQWEWRVRPEPHEPRRIWITETDGKLGCYSNDPATFSSAERSVEFVEVLKEPDNGV